MPSHVRLTKEVTEATRVIAEGRVVAVPTGTSYAFAVDALQGWALQRLRIVKGRPQEKSFTVFMNEELWAEHLELTDQEQHLLTNMAEQPLTLLVKPQASLEHLAQDGRIGLRVIDHQLMDDFAKAAKVPLTATSANRSGMEACYETECVRKLSPGIVPDELLDEATPRGASGTTYNLSLAAVLDGGSLSHTEPTTLARIRDGKVEIVRQGQLTEADISPYL